MPRDFRGTLEHRREGRNRYKTIGYNVNKLYFSRYLGERRAASQRTSQNSGDLINDVIQLEDSLPTLRVTITGLNDANKVDEDKRRYLFEIKNTNCKKTKSVFMQASFTILQKIALFKVNIIYFKLT